MDNSNQQFEMVAKTFQGLEEVLAEELRGIGAVNVEPGLRMVAFEGTLETLYRANMCCRTALRILKPIYKFKATDPEMLYDRVKEYDWSTMIDIHKTFAIDSVVNSNEFTHSRYVTYKVKDAIVDWFRDRYNERPKVRLTDADMVLNVHISADNVTLSVDSSGESLHKRGWRVATTEAPINEVLAAGIILKSGWRGDQPLVDPMCGSGTFLVEAAMIATGTMPGIYRRHFAFEQWPDFDAELFESIYNDESSEREFHHKIYGCDISPRAIEIARANLKSAGMLQHVSLEVKPVAQWTEAPEGGIPGTIVTNPPYGERISVEDMTGFYQTIGNRLKFVFSGYHAWIIGYRREYFDNIGLAPSVKETIFNGNLECELREYVMFDGDYKSYVTKGGRLREDRNEVAERSRRPHDRRQRRWDDEEAPRQRRDRSRDDRPRRDSRRDEHGGRSFGRDDSRRDPQAGRRNGGDRYPSAPQRRDDRRDSRRDDRRDDRRDNRRGSTSKWFDPAQHNTGPSLPPPADNVFMRERRGKRKFGSADSSADDSAND